MILSSISWYAGVTAHGPPASWDFWLNKNGSMFANGKNWFKKEVKSLSASNLANSLSVVSEVAIIGEDTYFLKQSYVFFSTGPQGHA